MKKQHLKQNSKPLFYLGDKNFNHLLSVYYSWFIPCLLFFLALVFLFDQCWASAGILLSLAFFRTILRTKRASYSLLWTLLHIILFLASLYLYI